jgi:hypothetical protein
LRDPVVPRYFVAGYQALDAVKSPTLLMRTAGDAAAELPAARRTVQRVDAALPIVSAGSVEQQIAPLTAQDRTTAQLAMVFGGVALTLAAIGLYGVLSYGISRRTSEIAQAGTFKVTVPVKPSWRLHLEGQRVKAKLVVAATSPSGATVQTAVRFWLRG